MLRQGPIPRAVHGMLEYAIAAVLIAAPFVLGFSDEGAPTAVSIISGVVVLMSGASTECFPTSLIKSVPIGMHIALDFILGALFIAAPFLFGFSDDSTPTAFFIVMGVLGLLITLATRWRPERTPEPA
jgi:VIT1/CCC1 family predicted Fe2+/Mn2+ transporter